MSYLLDESISIIIPTYNRKKFEKLIEYNINIQTYPFIKEIIIGDDGDISETLSLNIPYTIYYYRLPRMTIGQKRNLLISKANSKYVINMDTDDFYHKDYISHSIFTLIDKGKKCCGSADMYIYQNKTFYKQCCMFLHLLNEATICMEKSLWETNGGYAIRNNSEGAEFIKQIIKYVCETNKVLMCCLSHNNNTIDKKVWCNDNYKTNDKDEYKNHIEKLSTLNIL